MSKLLLDYFPKETRELLPRLLEEVQRADMLEEFEINLEFEVIEN